jgi:ribosomal-protein-alanine N-acetyltransferase
MSAPVLESADLILRPFHFDDVFWVRDAYADPAMRMWHRKDLRPPAAAEAWVAAQARSPVTWAAVRPADGQPLGQVALRAVDVQEGSAMCGYWVVPEHRGEGVAVRALSLVVAHTFEHIALHRLELTHSVHNQPSCKVAERAGFRLEGTKRSQLRHADGWHDMHLHARIADDS